MRVTQMTDLELLDGDFHSASPERAAQERLAKRLAKAKGWKAVGPTYQHPTRGKYLMREMDGWADLCGNEGITPAGRAALAQSEDARKKGE